MHATSRTPGLIRRAIQRLVGPPEPLLPIQPSVVVHDIQIGAPPGVSTKGAKLPSNRQKPTILTYEHKQFRAGFVEPEYDLAEIYKAMDSIAGCRPVVVRVAGRVQIRPVEQLFESIPGQLEQDGGREYLYPSIAVEALTDSSCPIDPDNLPDWFLDRLRPNQAQAYREHKSQVFTQMDGRGQLLALARRAAVRWNRFMLQGAWAKVKYFVRHRVDKKMYTVRSAFGETIVTEDHGLMSWSPNGLLEVKPTSKKYAPISVTGLPAIDELATIDLTQYVPNCKEVSVDGSIVRWASSEPYASDGRYRPFSFIGRLDCGMAGAAAFARLAGAYLSEGSVSGGRMLSIASSNRAWLHSLAGDFETVFCRDASIFTEDNGMSHLTCSNRLIAGIFASSCGTTSGGKRIPDQVYHWPKHLRKALLEVYLQGDGYTNPDSRRTCTTKSTLLAAGLQFLFKLEGSNVRFAYPRRWNRVYYQLSEVPGSKGLKAESAVEISSYHGSNMVYDLEVEGTHHFVDGVGNLLLHNTESYLRLSYDKHEELILKGQWKLVGQNEQTLSYVLRRITEIGWSQNEPFERIIESGIEDLVEAHNVFYVLARRETGKLYKSRFGRMLSPISGIFSPNPATMRPFIETSWKTNLKHIKEWWQITGGRIIKKFRPHNVIHMAFRKKKGHIFGTPYSVPVLDDILAMRRIEELVEVLVHKHAFPFFHYRVGTELEPAREFDDGHSEVDDVRAEIANMPFEGGLVTPYRHEIVVLGTKNKAVNAEPYLKYFEARVLSGLNLSGIDMGRGETANRSTAQTMSRGLSDRCTRFQNFFCAWFTFMILDEFVYEVGLPPTPENRVYLVFPTIDKEEERAHENHTLALYQGSIITEVEARTKIGMDPLKAGQRKDLFFNRVAKPLAIIKAIDEPYTGEAKTAMGSKSSVANREQPENKSKKLTSKPRVSANDAMPFVESLWVEMHADLLSNLDGPHEFCSELKDTLSIWVEAWMTKGLERYKDELKPATGLYLGANVKSGFLEDVLGPKVDQLEVRLRQALDTAKSEEDRILMVDSTWSLVEQLVDQIGVLSESYSYARIAQVDKHKLVRWELTDQACKTCRELGSLQIHKFSWEEMRYHEGCMDRLIVDSSKELS